MPSLHLSSIIFFFYIFGIRVLASHIMSIKDPTRCLEMDLTSGEVSLGDCEQDVAQQWFVNADIWQISTAMDEKICLQVQPLSEKEMVDDFLGSQVNMARCRYAEAGYPKGFPDGYQKLMMENETILWRGQSKSLPVDIKNRYCVEWTEQKDDDDSGNDSGNLSLQHCNQTKDFQQWTLIEDTRSSDAQMKHKLGR